jgi:hypothetical protein
LPARPVDLLPAVHGPSLDPTALAEVGLPAEISHGAGVADADPTVELLRMMDALERPEPLPRRAGAVIAVVGPASQTMGIAESFAAELGTSPDEILVATRSTRWARIDNERRINSVDLALERRRSWRRRRSPTIIAIEADIGPGRGEWAGKLLEAIDPTAVWGVVDAIRKPEDVHAWSEQLGGLDALAVYGIDDTVSPAAVLGVGVPVGLLDGQEATGLRWTSILAGRLGLAA